MVTHTRKWTALLVMLGAMLMPAAPTLAADKNAKSTRAKEEDFYQIITLPIPDDIVLECGGLEMMPDGKLAVSTRHGDIYMVEGAFEDPPDNLKFTRWATGMHEVMGLAYRDGWLYAIQRGEVTRLKDADNRGHATVYETFCDDWGISGDYHEYAFMSKFDREGNLWVLLTLTGSFTSEAEFRGWCLRITPDGKALPTCSGIRSPGGIGFNHLGEVWYADNQGPWNGGCALRELVPGSFQGHPIGNKWYSLAPNMGTRPQDPKTNSRIYVEAARIPELVPPAVIQPYNKVGQSQSGIVCDMAEGKFGPFVHQMFSADQSHSNIARYIPEKIKGRYQGVVIPFREGFASGIVPMLQAPDGSIIVGGTNRGWGSRGPKEYALERLVWTGKTAFEVLDQKVTPDGFELSFTEPVDKATAGNAKSYNLSTFTYVYREDYGSPEVDQTKPTVKSATVSEDGKKVRLVVDGMKIGSIHELNLDAIRSAKQEPLLHPMTWYTLWNLPDAAK